MKYLFSVIFIILITSSSYSQDSTWQYGYQIGGNLSSFQGNNPYGREAYSNLGFNFGMYIKYVISRLSNIFLEFRYVNKGAQWGCSWVPSICAKSRRSFDASYIELPIYYSATWVEWALIFAGIAAFCLFFTLLIKLVPIIPMSGIIDYERSGKKKKRKIITE